MEKFIMLSKLTDEGRKTVKMRPERIKEVNVEIEKMGAKVLEQYAVLGEYDFVNIQGAKNLCEIAREKRIKTIIFLSSVAIYGFADPNTDEDGSPNYFNDYGRTKHLAEKEYIKWYRESPNERNLIIIRPTVIFGEGNRGNVYNLIEQIAKKRFIDLGLLDPIIKNQIAHSNIFNIGGDKKLYAKLLHNQIICSMRGNGIRVSFGMFNSEKDLDKLIDCIES